MAAPLLLGITQGTNLIINLAMCLLRGELGQGWSAEGDSGKKTQMQRLKGAIASEEGVRQKERSPYVNLQLPQMILS